MTTATDNLTGQTYTVVRPATMKGATIVRDEQGAEVAVLDSQLTFHGDPAPAFTPGPLKAVPGSLDPVDGKANAHTQRIAPGVVQLHVRFANGKRRSVGEYPSHKAAQDAYNRGAYGF